MKILSLIIYSAVCFSCIKITVAAISSSITDNAGYYWRDYTGDIPADAVPGGKDGERKTTYIGQTVHTNGAIIPGQIDASKRVLYYYRDAASHTATRNVKILCSPYPEQLEWIKTSVLDIRFLTQRHLVPGGFDSDYPLLIGRALVNSQIVVGKITVFWQFEGFRYAAVGMGGYQHKDFEVLSYNHRCDVQISLSTNPLKRT